MLPRNHCNIKSRNLTTPSSGAILEYPHSQCPNLLRIDTVHHNCQKHRFIWRISQHNIAYFVALTMHGLQCKHTIY